MKLDLAQMLEAFNNLNDKLRYSIFAVVLLVILVLDVFLLMMPQWSAIVQTNQDIAKLAANTQTVTVGKERIGQLKKNLNNNRQRLEAMNDKIRSLQDVPAILNRISHIADDNHVRIDQLKPLPQDQALLASQQGKYYVLPIVIQAHGGYHNFGHFLNTLEGEKMFFTLSDLNVQSNETQPDGHSFAMTIKVILTDKVPSKTL